MTGRGPIASMTGPNARLPMATVPPKPMNHRAMTRARSLLRRLCWMTVSLDVAMAK